MEALEGDCGPPSGAQGWGLSRTLQITLGSCDWAPGSWPTRCPGLHLSLLGGALATLGSCALVPQQNPGLVSYKLGRGLRQHSGGKQVRSRGRVKAGKGCGSSSCCPPLRGLSGSLGRQLSRPVSAIARTP